jgi:hypothetical protein
VCQYLLNGSERGIATTQIVNSSEKVVLEKMDVDVLKRRDYDGSYGIVLEAPNDPTKYAIHPRTAYALTEYLIENFIDDISTAEPWSVGVDVITDAVGISIGIAGGQGNSSVIFADLAAADSFAMKGIQNVTNNLATSLTNK